jgi:hypothetical protein
MLKARTLPDYSTKNLVLKVKSQLSQLPFLRYSLWNIPYSLLFTISARYHLPNDWKISTAPPGTFIFGSPTKTHNVT